MHRSLKGMLVGIGVGIGILLGAGGFVEAQLGSSTLKGVVPVWEAGGHYLQYGNDKVRVYDVILEPGQPSGMHVHQEDYVIVILEGGTIRVTFPDGRTQDVPVKAGEWRYLKGGVVHETMSVGPKRVRAIVVEIKP